MGEGVFSTETEWFLKIAVGFAVVWYVGTIIVLLVKRKVYYAYGMALLFLATASSALRDVALWLGEVYGMPPFAGDNATFLADGLAFVVTLLVIVPFLVATFVRAARLDRSRNDKKSRQE